MQLIVSDLDFDYGSTSIFKGLQFQMAEGSQLWLRGGSGSGKSTFLKLISGILQPKKGRISWDSHHLSQMDVSNRSLFRRKNIAYGDQDLHLADSWTVEQNLALISKSKSDIQKILTDLHLVNWQHHRLHTLSGGQKQKVLLARLILQNPSIVLLDEPTAHLDDQNMDLVMSLWKKSFQGKTSLIVSHDSRIGRWVQDSVTLKSELT